jgi:hypothetical protein
VLASSGKQHWVTARLGNPETAPENFYPVRYGLQGCSPAIRGLYREAPPSPVSRIERSQAIKSYQHLLEWVLPPLVIYAFEAH